MRSTKIAVLGGGVAGLAAAYYLAQHDADIVVLEKQKIPGGNCRTVEINGFSFDTGAHRFHDKDSRITEDLLQLMGDAIVKVRAPSKIFDETGLICFPLQPLDVLGKMSFGFTFSAICSLIQAKLFPRTVRSFEDFAVNSYGELMATKFLLNYSSKLWGMPCNEISVDIAGKRLNGINLAALVSGLFRPSTSRTAHYEGEFWYPVGGIQRISEALAAALGPERVLTQRQVTGLEFDTQGGVVHVEMNNRETLDAEVVVSTLPLPQLIAIMKPEAPQQVRTHAAALRFRNLRLAAFSLNRPQVNECSTMYFPDKKFLFTRLYEPRNRYPGMSPSGKTMLVAEVPCFADDNLWTCEEERFTATVLGQILDTGLISSQDVISSTSERMLNAYPVLQQDYAQQTRPIVEYLSAYPNLHLCGRNARFEYAWIHDMFAQGRDVAEEVMARPTPC